MATTTYANNSGTTVTLGGTTAPSSGSPETWTVSNSTSFPAAATGATQFHVVDPNLPAEKVLVTSITGSTWSVVRGAEGTTPVAHAPGFTIVLTVTAGDLTALSAGGIGVATSGDTSGATDTAAIQAALSALPSTGGRVRLGPGTFYLNAQVTVPYNAILEGTGPGTVLSCTGTPPASPPQNAFLWWHDTTIKAAGLPYASALGGALRDFTIDGTNAAAGTTGLSWGDAWGMRPQGIRVQNFTGAGSVGVWGINLYTWTEKYDALFDLINCTTLAIFDAASGQSPSWEYGTFDARVFVAATQQGVVIQGGSYLTGSGLFRLRGNVNAGSGTAGPLLTITGSGGSGPLYSKIGAGCEVQLNVENNGTGTPPQTIKFGSTGPTNFNGILNCFGSMVFGGNSWTVSNAVAGNLSLGGVLQHDSQLLAVNTAPSGWL